MTIGSFGNIGLRVKRGSLRLAACLAVLTSVACSTVTLISAYDAEVDQSATALQRKMDSFLTQLADRTGTPAASLDSNKQFYTDYAVDLRSVLVRAESSPKNSITVQQLKLMQDNLDKLKTAHGDPAGLTPEAIEQFRNLFNQGWQAIITLELAKKRGEQSK